MRSFLFFNRVFFLKIVGLLVASFGQKLYTNEVVLRKGEKYAKEICLFI